jgi:hypothetical protein
MKNNLCPKCRTLKGTRRRIGNTATTVTAVSELGVDSGANSKRSNVSLFGEH